jgi:hypothetical protein
MEKTEMIHKLSERAREVAESLQELETQFNKKKEEFLKLQGALEALQQLQE